MMDHSSIYTAIFGAVIAVLLLWALLLRGQKTRPGKKTRLQKLHILLLKIYQLVQSLDEDAGTPGGPAADDWLAEAAKPVKGKKVADKKKGGKGAAAKKKQSSVVEAPPVVEEEEPEEEPEEEVEEPVNPPSPVEEQSKKKRRGGKKKADEKESVVVTEKSSFPATADVVDQFTLETEFSVVKKKGGKKVEKPSVVQAPLPETVAPPKKAEAPVVVPKVASPAPVVVAEEKKKRKKKAKTSDEEKDVNPDEFMFHPSIVQAKAAAKEVQQRPEPPVVARVSPTNGHAKPQAVVETNVDEDDLMAELEVISVPWRLPRILHFDAPILPAAIRAAKYESLTRRTGYHYVVVDNIPQGLPKTEMAVFLGFEKYFIEYETVKGRTICLVGFEKAEEAEYYMQEYDSCYFQGNFLRCCRLPQAAK